jgi:hypothetical protein
MRKRRRCRKELFVIDDGGIFDNALWERASGMPANRLATDTACAMWLAPTMAHLNNLLHPANGLPRLDDARGVIDPNGTSGQLRSCPTPKLRPR